MAERKLNYNIQYLRGICALVVFFSHSLNIYKIEWVQQLMPTPFHFFFDGQWAVIFFFTLSGFYYYKEERFEFNKYLRGLAKKALKIYPPHLLSLVTGWSVLSIYLKYGVQFDSAKLTSWASSFWRDYVGLKEFLGNAVVLMPHNPDSINPPSWYLGPEVKMFIIMPLIVALSNYSKLVIAVLLFVASWFVKFPIVSCVGPFVAGYLLHVVLKRCGAVRVNGLLAIFIMLAGICFLNCKNIVKSMLLDSSQVYFMMIQTMGAICLIFLANVLCFRGRFRVLLFMGNISYEFYIIHFIVLMLLAPWIAQPYTFVLVCFVLTVLLAYCVNWLDKKILLSI